MDILDDMMESHERILCNKADLQKIPIAATFELSPLCNLDCGMCYIHQKQNEVMAQGGLLDVDFWLDKAKQTMDLGMLFLLLTGGEPFLYPNFKELYIKLQQLGIYISINTNGTLIDEETIGWLRQYPPRRLNISLYGCSDETYLRLCKNPHGFTKVSHAIDLLQENGIQLRISHVRTPENVQEYDKIIEFCNRRHLYLAVNYYMFPPVRKYAGQDTAYCRLSAEQAAYCAFENIRNMSRDDFGEFLESVHNRDCKADPRYGVREIVCRAGNSTFWVNWKGEMSPCGVLNTPVVDLKTHTVNEGWNTIRAAVDKIRLSGDCAVCDKREYCMVCAAAALGETGKIDGTPEYLCAITSAYVELLEQEWKNRNENI